jgi:hypothetical protein
MSSKSLTEYFEGFGSGFIGLRAKLDADTFLDLATHLKKLHVHSTVSHGRVMQ